MSVLLSSFVLWRAPAHVALLAPALESQELAALKAKAGEKGAFGGKGLAYSGGKK